jgi:hypothetical protein
MEDPGPRYLRRDQECRNDGWKAYQSQKLIHRKHRHRPPRQLKPEGAGLEGVASIRPFCNLLRARHKLIGVSRPGNREQRENRNDS